MNHTKSSSLFGILFVCYAFFLLFLVFYLSHHPQREYVPEPILQPHFSSVPDFKNIKVIKERKHAFFEFIRPFVQYENQKISAQRIKLAELKIKIDRGEPLSRNENKRLQRWAKQYNLEPGSAQSQSQELELRMNVIPEALALAQAASESAWGTSRFARQGNNYFGQWCFSTGCGLVPRSRRDGAAHEVAKFSNPAESVKAYFNNLNTFEAYKELRELRYELDKAGLPITAKKLLPGLLNYSQRGKAYTKEIKSLINQNNLE